MRVTGSNRLAVPERHWAEFPNRRSFRRISFLIILTLVLVGSGIYSLRAQAAPTAAPKGAERSEGGFFLKKRGGTIASEPAPALTATADIRISGVVARVTVAQSFRNPHGDWLEGVYVFPLSRKGAVDRMVMRIGDRVVEGRIEERRAAKRQYEAAKRSGRKAGLVEQERPNIFTASVANIPPNGVITVEISYQQPVEIDDGVYSLRFPVVVNPRYIPEAPKVAGIGGSGWAANTVTVPDAERITPPMRDPILPRENPVAITVDLAPGTPVSGLRSLYHSVSITEPEAGLHRIVLADGAVPADSDFVLEWRPEAGDTPVAALFREQTDGATYVLAMIVPPKRADASDLERLPREAVFIIDTSGSMHGQSIRQAKQALRLAVDRLTPADRFNIVRFASAPDALFARPRQADRAALEEARDFIDDLQAEGGTEMRRALELALDGVIDSGRLRQIVLLTDGSIGNEAELFRLIRRGIGDSRLFTVGIGSAPNGHFMDRAARFGRGSFTFIGNTSEVADRMSALFAKLGEPMLTDIALTVEGGGLADLQPDRLPDLYPGEPIVATARLEQPDARVILTGRYGGESWSTTLAPSATTQRPGIAKLWARHKVSSLMDRRQDGMAEDEVRDAVLKVALPHQIMSRYTSLVAIEKTISRPAGDRLTTAPVPTNPPKGWTPPPKPGSGTPLQKAATPGVQQVAQSGAEGVTVMLHTRTATPAQLQIIAGLMLLGTAIVMIVVLRRQRRL
ncbi:MAG: marine proteobacterial sortase target protein [Pseudomonadota bacterium]